MPPKKTKAEESQTPVITLRETIKDGDRETVKTYRLDSNDLGPADDLISRQQTGFPVSTFMDNFGADAFVVFIWMARRKSGEPNLQYSEVVKKYPNYAALNAIEADWDGADEGADEDPLPDETS